MGISHVLKTILDYHRCIIILITPIILFISIDLKTKEMSALFILILMAVYWVTEALPLPVTSLIPAILSPAFGVVDADTISGYYLTDTNMLFLGSLMIATAFEYQNLHKRMAFYVLSFVGSNPRMLYMGFMLPTWFLSMWINNTSTTAMMLPIVDAVLSELEKTELETKDQEKSEHESDEDNNTNEKITLKDNVLQTTYVTIENGFSTHEHISKVPFFRENTNEANILKNNLNLRKGLYLAIAYASTCGGISTITGTGPNLIFYGNLRDMANGANTGVNFGTWMIFAIPLSILLLMITWFWLLIVYVGMKRTFKPRKNEDRDRRVKQIIQEEKDKLGPMTFGEGSCLAFFVLLVILWISREPGIEGWSRLFKYNGKIFVQDAQVAIFIAIIIMTWPARNPFYRNTEDFRKYGSGTLVPWKEIQQIFPWGILLLMGGGLALAEVCKVSGFSILVGQNLFFLSVMSPTTIVIVITLATSFLTELTSNTATASILLPIIMPLAVCLNVNPILFALPVTIACSLAFCLPVATPPNAIVFGKEALKVIDMIKSGLILNFIGVFTVAFSVLTYGNALFRLDTNPDWAGVCENNNTMSATAAFTPFTTIHS